MHNNQNTVKEHSLNIGTKTSAVVMLIGVVEEPIV